MNKGPFAKLDELLIDLRWTRDESFGDIRIGVGVEVDNEQVFAEVAEAVSAYLIPIIKEHIDPMAEITEAMVSPIPVTVRRLQQLVYTDWKKSWKMWSKAKLGIQSRARCTC